MSTLAVLSWSADSIAAHAKAATDLGHDEGQQDGGTPETLETHVTARQQESSQEAEHELTDDRRPEHELRPCATPHAWNWELPISLP